MRRAALQTMLASVMIAGLALLPQGARGQDVSDVDRATLGCAAGITTCSGQALRPDEIRLVLGLSDEAEARDHYVALYGDPARAQPDVGFGTYRAVAESSDTILYPATCGGQHEPEVAMGEMIVTRSPQGGVLWGGAPLYRYPVTPAEFMMANGFCGPLLQHEGLRALDWVGPVTHVFSGDPPGEFGETSGLVILGADRAALLFASAHAALPGVAHEDWRVTLYERIAAEDGSPVTPRPPRVSTGGGGGAGGGSAIEPPPDQPRFVDPADLPPLPVPFADLETAHRDPGSACQTLRNLMPVLRAMGMTDHVDLIFPVAGSIPQSPETCADLLRRLREADAAARADPQASTTPPFLHQLFGPVARP